jgi:hypothetical protein
MEGCKYRMPATNIIKNNVIEFHKKTKDLMTFNQTTKQDVAIE